MMNKKLTTLMFSLLLAVGWTSTAQAQRVPNAPAPIERDYSLSAFGKTSNTTRMNAPRRAVNDVYADTVFTKDQYSAIKYNWYAGTTASGTPTPASLTDVVTNPYQMYWLLRSTYLNTNIPGIRWNDVYGTTTNYFGVGRGWNIGTLSNPTEIYLYFSDQYAYFSDIKLVNAQGQTVWTWSSNSSYVGYSTDLYYTTIGGTTYYYFNNSEGGSMQISTNVLGSTPIEGLRIQVTGRGGRSESSTTYSYVQGITDQMFTTKYLTNGSTYLYDLYIEKRGNVSAPLINSYTVFLIKLKDFDENESDKWNKRTQTYSTQDLVNVFDEYFESIELLTDGLRVGENTDASGTVYAYTGVLNRFYFIGKGKTATMSADGSTGFDPYSAGPFYVTYEEFSPTTTDAGVETADFYNDMRLGKYYPVKHDCQTVLGLSHYFSMYGKDTTVYKSVAPLVLYIPDLRSINNDRNYEVGHQPQVGLYTIDLAAETEPSETYSTDSTYTVSLDWTSSLNTMVNNDVDQTYIIYKVEFDSLGNRTYTPLDTVYNQTTYDYPEPQKPYSQTFTYVIKGYPTDATNNPENQADGIFYVYSNLDDVQIPGTFDFMVLYRERYESDFKIQDEKNYYRNYLYPTNLAPGTGMTMGQLKKEWPNQTASYTLWRDDLGVAKLEIRAIRDKVYYRIQYYKDTQDTDWRNDITMPYPYVEIDKENN